MDFNKNLPCGAKLVKTQRGESSFVIARFKLTERRGRRRLRHGVAKSAYTAFLIERHRIVQWRRAADPPAQSSTAAG